MFQEFPQVIIKKLYKLKYQSGKPPPVDTLCPFFWGKWEVKLIGQPSTDTTVPGPGPGSAITGEITIGANGEIANNYESFAGTFSRLPELLATSMSLALWQHLPTSSLPLILSLLAHLVYFVWLHPATGTGLPFGLLSTPSSDHRLIFYVALCRNISLCLMLLHVCVLCWCWCGAL